MCLPLDAAFFLDQAIKKNENMTPVKGFRIDKTKNKK